MDQFDQVSVLKKSNVYFDGKCVSHTVILADGSRKTLGVILASELLFNTAAPEVMEIVSGTCEVRLKGQDDWKTYSAGQSFEIAGDSAFDIKTMETLDLEMSRLKLRVAELNKPANTHDTHPKAVPHLGGPRPYVVDTTTAWEGPKTPGWRGSILSPDTPTSKQLTHRADSACRYPPQKNLPHPDHPE